MIKLKRLLESVLNDGLIKAVSKYDFVRKMEMEKDDWSTEAVFDNDGLAFVLIMPSDDDTSLFLDAIDYLNSRANVLGWYPASVVVYYGFYNDGHMPIDKAISIIKSDKYDEITSVRIQYESKFGPEYNKGDLPKYIYHVTDKKYVDKIKKVGLVPRSKKKHSYHPDRVYFAEKLSTVSDLWKYGMNQYVPTPVFLKINTSKLPSNFRYFEDPQLPKRVKGFFTHQNIPPDAIKFLEVTPP